ncbi:protein FAM222B-like [Xiphophorus couchianus]|uniref:protein FAM222B-like n=1 Tax=Xiphophorus couchianus TaxID=32473 RepID=UPI00101691D8|nr:protein FAM222B-like [Xiphophorus couchianus]XP_027901657.1 protein FAM222B-like [Xiphophorus couchianus]
MLACLPASGDPAIRLLHRTQMNTGLQKWETTQKMRSATHPTPAELDAYAKKVADKPLSIQIFPNSIKVPQKKHVRRTVNGLDTSSSAQRHSPYPPQLAAGAGLLTVLRAPPRGLVKQPDGCRTRLQLKAAMNPQSGPYAAPSTLNLPHLAAQKQGAEHPQQSLAHPMALQHHQRSMAQSQALQQQQRLTHPPAVQRQPPPQDVAPCAAAMPQQHLPHMQTLKHQAAPAQSLGATQELRHVPDSVAMQAAPPGPPALPPPPYGARKLPDADAPPNVTVSTSTIPLSMAASLQQARPSDLSSIVLQINQLCQARAGMGATSVCEGQIANPSPISRNQLISASSRVSQHASGAGGGVSSCLLMDKPAALALAPACSNNNMAAFHPDSDKQMQQHLLQQKHQQQHLQQHLQQQQRSWAQHQLAHMQQPPEGAHPCKNPRLDPVAECAFPSHGLSYGHKPPAAAHVFLPKHAADKTLPPSSANCSYLNGHYLQPAWGAVPGAAGNNGNIPQDLPVGFQGGHAAAERILGAKYRPGKDGSAGQPKLLQHSVDFLGEDFQIPSMQEQSVEMMHKMHRGGGDHHHQGYH